MRMFPKEFPSGRRRKPKRQAERRVYEALAGSDRQGFVYYEWRKGYERIELDFAVWVKDLGRFALQVKGGRYLLSDGEWHLQTRDGVKLIESCPLDETKLAALDLHDDIAECACTPYNPFVIPVLVFPDMVPDPAIEKLARRRGVYVIWGLDGLLRELESIVRSRSVSDGLPMGRIAREVHGVTDGLIRLDEIGEETSEDQCPEARATPTLTLWVGGRSVLRIRAQKIHGHLLADQLKPIASINRTRNPSP